MKTLRILITLLLMCSPVLASTNVTTCQTLSAADTYILQNDVTSNGTCFIFTANGITLDLNGHTVTYDNATPIAVPNGSFESVLTGTWDVTGAANASRQAGAYLTPSVYVGSYALNVTTPTANQQIQSVDTVTLQANTTYSISGMVFNQVDDAITMTISFNGTSVIATQSGRTWRGFQYINAVYTTGGTTESYKINLNVTGAGAVASGSVFFDDIRVQQNASYGLDVGSGGWARQPHIHNGTITQGQAHGDSSHAINLTGVNYSDNPNYEIDHLTITVAGNSSHDIYAVSGGGALVHDNQVYSNVDTIKARDQYDGANIYLSNGYVGEASGASIYNNTIHSGIQAGIFMGGAGGSSTRMNIYGNNITLQSKYTNDFAIVVYARYGGNIYNNTVNCGTGNNTCRGLYMNSNGGSIHDNTVSVHYNPNNQEYYSLTPSGCGGAAYGIQVEDLTQNISIYNNNITANAIDCDATAMRWYGPSNATNINNATYNNTFTALAISPSTRIASALRVLETSANHMSFHNNILITNSNFIDSDGVEFADASRSWTLDSNTFTLSYPKASFYHPLISAGFLGEASNSPINVSITNNCYSDSTVESDISNAHFMTYYTDYNSIDSYASNISITKGDCSATPVYGSTTFSGGGTVILTGSGNTTIH